MILVLGCKRSFILFITGNLLRFGAPGAKIDYKCGLIKSKKLTLTMNFLIKQISNKILILSRNKSLLKN